MLTNGSVGLDWDKLPKGSTIVDVGGGIGSYMVPLVENFPDLKYVVQDLPESIENAEAVRASPCSSPFLCLF